MMANFVYFLDLEFQTFFYGKLVLLDETLIPIKFKDEHRHGSGDTRRMKVMISSQGVLHKEEYVAEVH